MSQPQEHTRADAGEEKELILAEFKRIGGTIREEFVDADINSIIQNQFGGDRMGLERRLAEEGQTYEQFKTQRRETIIVQVMKARTTQGIADTGEKQQAVDNWLAELRMKSLGASSRPTASSASEE